MTNLNKKNFNFCNIYLTYKEKRKLQRIEKQRLTQQRGFEYLIFQQSDNNGML